MHIHAGLDVGSTTIKVVAVDEKDQVIYSVYRRHKSDVKRTVFQVLENLFQELGNVPIKMAVTGSGGMFLEQILEVPFIQEVISETEAIKKYYPQTDVIIELGGEDSKITYLSGSVEQRMNSICAGGTGAFIDQMASLLNTTASGLNDLADDYGKIYPIASRCGVFAKTDVQALLNDGASNEDIAMSIFQSIVNQTISNLACGRPIEGNITFLGGPLHFLPNLRKCFIHTLNASAKSFTTPEDGQLFVAHGAALIAEKASEEVTLQRLIDRIHSRKVVSEEEKKILEPLFSSEEEYERFKIENQAHLAKFGDIKTYEGPVYLGIDAGSTTTKEVVIGEDGEILYHHYASNMGKPLEHVIEDLKEIYASMNEKTYIANSAITGYGEDFIRAAVNVDIGEVETIAHYTAAHYFDPDVDFILDIGGQDMKAMHIRNGVIDSIKLNESCSSGCGSFLSTFAASVGMSVEQFQEAALRSKAPVDLGSRCTVFMNSKVKQAQKEGFGVEDIAAGLCYSVIKNAIQKVIKVRDPKRLGDHLVVQGGTFYGDAILRAFEKITGRKATRPSIAGLMGAMGAALIAREKSTGHSALKTPEELADFTYTQKHARCGRCTNNCALTINIFSDGSRYISGNRCERGAGIERKKNDIPDLYQYKYDRLFHYYSEIPKEEAKFPAVGMPRALNMYENYPLWHTFFNRLGFPVFVSDPSSREIYEKGLSSISSETICYPAKLGYGHIEDLVNKGAELIWYPCVFYEEKQFARADNQLNCPVVCGFPEVIKNNVSSLEERKVTFMNPFLSFRNEKVLADRLIEIFELFSIGGKIYHINPSRIRAAVKAAWEEQQNYHQDIQREGRLAMDWLEKNHGQGIVLAGRPYHIDPEINHGIPELINGMGLAVLSEDAVAMNAGDLSLPVRVLDQWVYHSRLYRAAEYVANSDQLELIQLNSFGCGLDAVTTDQVQDILESKGKIYTLLKIDEVSNLGAVKIRIRSLIEALHHARELGIEQVKKEKSYAPVRSPFTREMKKDYTILVPAMAPDHFQILSKALNSEGYHLKFLDRVDADVINAGLKYVNNDSCYPSITVVGQMMEAIESGKVDPKKTALLMTQTGGVCRASNYVGYIRKALQDMGYPDIPVIALSAQGIETSPGFKITPGILDKSLYALLLGDLVMRCSNATKPYEKRAGQTDQLKKKWIELSGEFCERPSFLQYRKLVQKLVHEFDQVPRRAIRRPRVGIVGEILVKYLPEANNNLQGLLEEEGAEVVVLDLMDFLLYCARNAIHKADLLGTSQAKAAACQVAVHAVEWYRQPIRKALSQSYHFEEMTAIEEIEKMAEEVVSVGNQYGEGWLLAGEMIELIRKDCPNIVCIQPFGCLPNHITGKGVMKAIRSRYEQANIIAVDYDPGASEVNQINRIKLMMSSAWEAVGGKPQEILDAQMGKKQKNKDQKTGDTMPRERKFELSTLVQETQISSPIKAETSRTEAKKE